MHVDQAEPRQLQQHLGQQPAVGGDHAEVGVERRDRLEEILVRRASSAAAPADPRRFGARLDRRRGHLLTAAARLVRLRDHADHDGVARGEQRIERRHRERRGAEEDDASGITSRLPFAARRWRRWRSDAAPRVIAAQAIDEQRRRRGDRSRAGARARAGRRPTTVRSRRHDRVPDTDPRAAGRRSPRCRARSGSLRPRAAGRRARRTSGLTSTRRSSARRPADTSTMQIRSGTPTCGAARPTPGARLHRVEHVVDERVRSRASRRRRGAAPDVVQRRLAVAQDRPEHVAVSALGA